MCPELGPELGQSRQELNRYHQQGVPQMNPMKEVLECLGKELAAKLQEYDAFSKHNGEKGERRENAVAGVMERFLPRKFRIATGEVVSVKGVTSRQIDILIYDCLHSPVLCDARDTKIVPAESVYAAIEVKPNLNRLNDLHAALDNIRSTKSLPRNAILPSHGGHHHYHGPSENPPVYGAIITYGEHWDAKRLGDEMASYCSRWPREHWVDQICVCDDANVLYAVSKDGGVRICRPFWTHDGVPQLCLQKTGSIAFGFFLLELLYHIGQMDLFPPDFQRYLCECTKELRS